MQHTFLFLHSTQLSMARFLRLRLCLPLAAMDRSAISEFSRPELDRGSLPALSGVRLARQMPPALDEIPRPALMVFHR